MQVEAHGVSWTTLAVAFLRYLVSEAIYGGSIYSWLAILCLCVAMAALFIKRLLPHCFDLIAVGWLLVFFRQAMNWMGAFGVIGPSDTTPPPQMTVYWMTSLWLSSLLPAALLTIPAVFVLSRVQPEFRIADHKWTAVAVLVALVDWILLISFILIFLCPDPYQIQQMR